MILCDACGDSAKNSPSVNVNPVVLVGVDRAEPGKPPTQPKPLIGLDLCEPCTSSLGAYIERFGRGVPTTPALSEALDKLEEGADEDGSVGVVLQFPGPGGTVAVETERNRV